MMRDLVVIMTKARLGMPMALKADDHPKMRFPNAKEKGTVMK